MLIAALTGFIFGFVGSMPVAGPIAILVLGRGLSDRVRSGRYLALGAALAESVYAYLAFWGFSALLVRYTWVVPASRAAAAVLLSALGLHLARKPRNTSGAVPPPDPNVGNKRSFLLGFTITALNPTLIATWTAAVTLLFSLDIVHFDKGSALPFSIGASTGIASWFSTLLFLLARFRNHVSAGRLSTVLRSMGVLLVLLGVSFALRFVLYFT